MADTTAVDATVEETILYDLTIQAEWQREPETTHKISKEKVYIPIRTRMTSGINRTASMFLRNIGVSAKEASFCRLQTGLIKRISSQQPWSLAVTRDGEKASILQDQVIEIRWNRDDFSSVIGRCSVSHDDYPQWRRMTWSLDGDMLAYSDSKGLVQVFDILGTQICTIQSTTEPKPNTPVDLSRALAGLIFKESTEKQPGCAELLVINYQGILESYLIYRDSEPVKQHKFLLTSHYPKGVSTVIYHHEHNLLLVGGESEPETDGEQKETAIKLGITTWRNLSDYPYYKIVTDYEQDLHAAKKMKWVPKLNLRGMWQGGEQDCVYKLSLSPSGTMLAAVHHSGLFSLWDVPSLRLRKTWKQEDQDGYDQINPEVAENPKKKKVPTATLR